MATKFTSFGDAVCSQSMPALPRVPTPIQPRLILSFAPRAEITAGPGAGAGAFKKLRRFSLSAIEKSPVTDDSRQRSERRFPTRISLFAGATEDGDRVLSALREVGGPGLARR